MQPLNLPGELARAYIERDGQVISPSYPRGYPFVMDHGLGTEVWDVDGNRFLDFEAGIAVAATGHSNPRVVKAIRAGRKIYSHLIDFYHDKWITLGENWIFMPLGRSVVLFMTNSGTESVEAAIKLARYHTGDCIHRLWARFMGTARGGHLHRQQSHHKGLLPSYERRGARALPQPIPSAAPTPPGYGPWRNCRALY